MQQGSQRTFATISCQVGEKLSRLWPIWANPILASPILHNPFGQPILASQLMVVVVVVGCWLLVVGFWGLVLVLLDGALAPVVGFSVTCICFVRFASSWREAEVSQPIADAIRLGRMTALTKPNGGVRGIVAGDVIRRLTARTIAQQLDKVVEAATAPFQYALSTRAGCECVAHTLQALCEINPETTVVSVDGISAYGGFEACNA